MTAAHDLTLENLSPLARSWLESGRFVDVDQHRIFVQERGSGPVVLLMHGFPTSSFDWKEMIEALSDRWRLFTFDFLGFGLSDKPTAFSYSLFQQADLVESLAKRLGITQAIAVSHDMGTSVHCELLARQLEGRLAFDLTKSVFTNGSMLQWMAKITPFQELLAANATLPQAIEICRTSIEAMYVPALQSLMRRPEVVTDHVGRAMLELLQFQSGNLRLPAIAGYMRERYVHADRWLGSIERSKSPASFLWADGDPIAHAEMGREHARRATHARYLELTGLGHFLMIEDPKRVADGVAELIS